MITEHEPIPDEEMGETIHHGVIDKNKALDERTEDLKARILGKVDEIHRDEVWRNVQELLNLNK